MASHQRQAIPYSSYPFVAWKLLIVVLNAIIGLTTSTGTYRNAVWPWRRTIGIVILRAIRPLTSSRVYQLSQPTTGESSRSSCVDRGLEINSHTLPCGRTPSATLHEIVLDQHTHAQIYLYFHGGGYVNPIAGDGHIPVVLDCAKAQGAGRIFLLEYGLAPGLQYPGQLCQASSALNVLLTRFKCRMDRIVIGGDSAGGNLALALLAHIKQPHPLVPRINTEAGDDKLRGALLISPWVTNDFTAPSYTENAHKDFLTANSMVSFRTHWAPKNELWADFLEAPVGFWKDLPVNRILVTVGGFEVFRDDARKLAARLGAVANKDSPVRFDETPAEAHVQCVIDAAVGLPPCKSLLDILQWCHNLP